MAARSVARKETATVMGQTIPAMVAFCAVVAELNGRRLVPLVATPPDPACVACVIIPAKDEAAHIGTALTALAAQTDTTGRPLDPATYEVIVLANNCSDATAGMVRAFGLAHPTLRLHVVGVTLPPEVAGVGRARQMLMDEAYLRLSGLGNWRAAILSTDADTQVAPNWIAANLHEIALGADAVGGRLLTDAASRAALDPVARRHLLYDVGYRVLIAELESRLYPVPGDPWPRHHQHFGASLAVTVETYEQLGGLPSVRALEDIYFYYGLLRFGKRLRHSPLVRAATSARQNGRTQRGFSAQLCEWAELAQEGRAFLVDSASAVEMRLHCRHTLRGLQKRVRTGETLPDGEIAAIANMLCLPPDMVRAELETPQAFDTLRGRLEAVQDECAAWFARWPRVPLAQAVAELRLRVAGLRQLGD